MGRFYVLIEIEEVAGVIFALEFDQPRVIAAKCRPDRIRVFFGEEIQQIAAA